MRRHEFPPPDPDEVRLEHFYGIHEVGRALESLRLLVNHDPHLFRGPRLPCRRRYGIEQDSAPLPQRIRRHTRWVAMRMQWVAVDVDPLPNRVGIGGESGLQHEGRVERMAVPDHMTRADRCYMNAERRLRNCRSVHGSRNEEKPCQHCQHQPTYDTADKKSTGRAASRRLADMRQRMSALAIYPFFLSDPSIPSKSLAAASTVRAGPVSLKNTAPLGPSTIAP